MEEKYYVETYGCQQNENDSERIRGVLESLGYAAGDRETADVLIFNTCAVRENAESRVFGNIGAVKHLKELNPRAIIGVCGCMTQQKQNAEEIKKKYRHIDFVLGTNAMSELPKVLCRIKSEKTRFFDIDNIGKTIREEICENLPIRREDPEKAFVTVMYGCNNYCSYCIVPYVRGRERSRKPDKIIEEIKSLIANGCKEIMLLGQNVNSYGHDIGNLDFTGLLEQINALNGDFIIRFMTSHPKDATDTLIDAVAYLPKMSRHIHLPFQSGSNRILELMNRGYTREKYLDLINKIKARNITLTSDAIVGFPTETQEDFGDTLEIVRTAKFKQLYMFMFSKRVGTPAADMNGQISQAEKSRRLQMLIKLQKEMEIDVRNIY